jgi:hypothetical protein
VLQGDTTSDVVTKSKQANDSLTVATSETDPQKMFSERRHLNAATMDAPQLLL